MRRTLLILLTIIAVAAGITEVRSEQDCPEGMSFIPAGEFRMGCSEGDDYCGGEEEPQRQVRITKPFCIDQTEVSQRDFEAVMEFNPADFPECGPDCPVENTYWYDARKYCRLVGKRLPTEAEWEYAARAGSDGMFFWGDEMDGDYTWYGGNSGPTTHPVGTKKPNAFGLHDVLGNVWEWVEDCYDRNWYEMMPEKDPFNDGGGDIEGCMHHVIKGSSWLYFTKHLRLSVRLGLPPDNECIPVGFRCAADIEPEKDTTESSVPDF